MGARLSSPLSTQGLTTPVNGSRSVNGREARAVAYQGCPSDRLTNLQPACFSRVVFLSTS